MTRFRNSSWDVTTDVPAASRTVRLTWFHEPLSVLLKACVEGTCLGENKASNFVRKTHVGSGALYPLTQDSAQHVLATLSRTRRFYWQILCNFSAETVTAVQKLSKKPEHE